MIIQCPKCLTKFKMDDSKVKDEGTKVRCAKCKEVFVVTKEEVAPASTPIEPEKPIEKGALDFSFGSQHEEEEKEAPHFQGYGGLGEEAIKEPAPDFSFGELPERETPSVEEKETGIDFGGMAYGEVSFSEPDATPPAHVSGPSIDFNEEKISFEESEDKGEEKSFESPQEEPFSMSAEPSAPEQQSVHSVGVLPVSGEPYRESLASVAAPEEEPFRDEIDDDLLLGSTEKKAKPANVRNILLAVLICVALAVPLWYLWTNYRGAESGHINLSELNGSYSQNAEAGNIFVITGMAVNNTNKPRSFFQIKGTLFNSKGEKLIEKEVYCGNIFSSKELATLPRAKIEGDLINKVGNKLSNINLAPGKSVPFTIIFFDLPKETAEFSVEVVGSQIAS